MVDENLRITAQAEACGSVSLELAGQIRIFGRVERPDRGGYNQMAIMYSDLQIEYIAQGLLTLAASDMRTAAFKGIFWLIGIVALSTLIVVVGAYVRRRYRLSELPRGLGLTLAELRKLHQCGELTQTGI